MSQTFNFLGKKNHRTLRLIERSRQWKLRKSLMRNQGLSPALAKEIAADYRYEKKP
jgi:hypothetical protein